MSIIDDIIAGAAKLGGAVVDNAAPLALGTAGLAFAKEAYDKVGKGGREAYETYSQPGGLADVLSDRLEFRPYTVTSPQVLVLAC